VQPLDHPLAPFLIAMDEDLGVGLGGEPVAGREELLAELAVVVDLSVLDDPHRRVLVGHRLVAALDVDDRQPRHAESYAVWMDSSASRPIRMNCTPTMTSTTDSRSSGLLCA